MEPNELTIEKTIDMKPIERVPVYEMISILYETDLFVDEVIRNYAAKQNVYDTIIITLEALENTCREKRLLLQARTRDMTPQEQREANNTIRQVERAINQTVPEEFKEPKILKTGEPENDKNLSKRKQGTNKNTRQD